MMWPLSLLSLAALTRGFSLPQLHAGRYGFASSASCTTLGTPMPSLDKRSAANTATRLRLATRPTLPPGTLKTKAAALHTISYVIKDAYEPDSAVFQARVGPHPALTPACDALPTGQYPPIACSILAGLGRVYSLRRQRGSLYYQELV